MKITAEPRSDQINADDFIGSPATFTIAGVVTGKAEQKYDVQLAETDRAWRPPLTVLRLLIAAWGDDAASWTGHRVTLYRDESVRFGKDAVGGIRVSHLSHIDKPLTVNLTASRGKRAKLTVQPLADAPKPPTVNRNVAAVQAFDKLGVEQSQLETHLGKPSADWDDNDFATLQALHEDVRAGNFTFGGGE